MTVAPVLTSDQLRSYQRDGYLFPIRVMTEDQAAELRAAIDEHLNNQLRSERYELTDPVVIRRVDRQGTSILEYDEEDASTVPTTLPFLFNLWKYDERFRAAGRNQVLARIAAQILGSSDLLLMEDNAVVKNPHTGVLSWHQDYSYWPLASPAIATAWVALDHISVDNGGMQVVPGSHRWGEYLPVSFGDSSALMGDERPGVPELTQDPAADGYPVISYELGPGECGFHDPLLWHSSSPNSSDRPRVAFILRYLVSGTIWLGGVRMPYSDVGCLPGEPVGPEHFPVISVSDN